MVNWGNKKMTPRGMAKTLLGTAEGTELIEYKKALPDYPIECLFWTTEGGGKIIVKPELLPINWAGLMADFVNLDADMKMKLGSGYTSIIQALIEADETYLLRMYVSRETSLSDEDRDTLRSILQLHNVNLDQWIDEIPF